MISIRLKILFAYLIAYCLLCYGYAAFIVPIFGYEGYQWVPNSIKIYESLSAILFFTVILPARVKKPSDFFVHFHFLLPILAMLVMYSMMDLPRAYMYVVLLSFLLVCIIRNIHLPNIKGDIVPLPLMIGGLLAIAAIYIVSIIWQGGLQYFNLNLNLVYEFRSLAAGNLPSIYGYLSPMITSVVLPFILLLAVYRRRWLIAVLAVAGSVMECGLTNHKAPLFYPPLVLGIYYVMHFKQQKVIPLLLAGYIVLIFVSLLTVFITGDFGIIAGAMFFRRIYFTPVLLNFCYYDFFSTHPHTMFSESKLSFGLIQYPYSLPATNLIGYTYFDSAENSANTGWLGSGYMQFGFAGMFIYALIVGFLLSLADGLAKSRDLAISVAILLTPLLTLFLSSDLPTALLTHGIMLALFLNWSSRLKTHNRLARHELPPALLEGSYSHIRI